MSARAGDGRPRKQVILAAHFPGVNNTTVWADPAAGSQIDFSSFEHLARMAERILAGREAGLDGWRLRPGEMAPDLTRIADGVAHALRAAGVRPPLAADGAAPGSLRARLGLPRPASRYAGSGR